MKYNNLVCIVIPVYNAEKLLGECIKSIIKQTFTNWRLILVDDESTDSSGFLCDNYANVDDRIIAIHLKKKDGQDPRRVGAKHHIAQSSQYIMFVDNDDILPKDAIEVLFENAVKYEADVVCGRQKKMYKGLSFSIRNKRMSYDITEPVVYDKERIMNELFISFYGISYMSVAVWAKIYKTEIVQNVINENPPYCLIAGDLILSIGITEKANRLVIIPDYVYHYRIGGMSSKYMPNWIEQCIMVYNYKKGIGLRNNIPEQWWLYLDIELMNMFKSGVYQNIYYIDMGKERLKNGIIQMCELPEIKEAAEAVSKSNTGFSSFANYVLSHDTEKIINQVGVENKKNRVKRIIKRLLF